MKYAFYVGCTTLSRLPGYEKATRKLAEKLGIELFEMPGSSCCGTTYLESLDEVTALSLAARNICIAEELGLNILTICNGCAETLTKANNTLKKDPILLTKVNNILKEVGHEFKGTIEVKHLIRILKEDYGLTKLKEAVINSYTDLKVGAHYGCHLLKPSDIMNFDDPNRPNVMDEIITTTGAVSVSYPYKMECCGGPIMGIREDVTWSIGLDKINIVKNYADALITSCPFCYITYERSQLMRDNALKLPIIHLPQLLGISLGLTAEEVGLSDNKICPELLIKKKEG